MERPTFFNNPDRVDSLFNWMIALAVLAWGAQFAGGVFIESNYPDWMTSETHQVSPGIPMGKLLQFTANGSLIVALMAIGAAKLASERNKAE